MLLGRSVICIVAVAVMTAASPQAPAEERFVPQASAGEDTGAKPAEDGMAKTNPSEKAVPKSRLVSILGREITNREGDTGRVIDVLVDLDGYSGAVVVEFGGFMGIGSRKVAVAWGALHFVREGDRSMLTAEITREQIRDTPEYKPGEPPSVLTIRSK